MRTRRKHYSKSGRMCLSPGLFWFTRACQWCASSSVNQHVPNSSQAARLAPQVDMSVKRSSRRSAGGMTKLSLQNLLYVMCLPVREAEITECLEKWLSMAHPGTSACLSQASVLIGRSGPLWHVVAYCVTEKGTQLLEPGLCQVLALRMRWSRNSSDFEMSRQQGSH